MARGGRRGGTKGAAYPNRTDLRTGPLPVAAPRGLPYGERQQLLAAQRAVPMGAPTPPAPAAPAGPPQAAPLPQGPAPGTLPFTHPTQRPNEPITAGLPMGPGPGPEVLGNLNAGAQNVRGLLSSLAQAPGATADIAELSSYANSH
jgi:hypothetical protein